MKKKPWLFAAIFMIPQLLAESGEPARPEPETLSIDRLLFHSDFGFTRFGFYQIGGLEEDEPYPRYHLEIRAEEGETDFVFWYQPVDHDSEHAPEVSKTISFDPEQWHTLSFEWVAGAVTYILDGKHELRIDDPLFDYTRTGWKIWSHNAPLHIDRLTVWAGE